MTSQLGTGISRRAFLVGTASAALAACTSNTSTRSSSASTNSTTSAAIATSSTTTTLVDTTSSSTTTLALPNWTTTPFTLGVASGDPTESSIQLWTRLAPDPLVPDGLGGAGDHAVGVNYTVAIDDKFASVTAHGSTVAGPATGFVVRPVVEGLVPGTTYYYKFEVGGFSSPVGRSKTAPKAASGDAVKFGFTSCQHYELGKYAVHASMAEDDIDVVVFLGDFIYEYAPIVGLPRQHLGGECFTLADYRRRYAVYLTDPDLQASRAAHPWLVIWDDHEIVNNYHGDSGAPTQAGGPEFEARQLAAYQAWWEHQPASVPQPTLVDAKIYRSVRWGLANFILTDGRQYRTPDGCVPLGDGFGKPCPTPPAGQISSLLGDAQEQWVADQFASSTATWDVLTSSTMMGRIKVGTAGVSLVNLDQWDGYTGAVDRVLGSIPNGKDVVVISGDLHTSVVADLITGIDTPNAKVAATEFVGPSVSSWADPTYDHLVTSSLALNPNVKYFEGTKHGYVRCVVASDKFTSTFRFVDDIGNASSRAVDVSKWEVIAGKPGAVPVPLG